MDRRTPTKLLKSKHRKLIREETKPYFKELIISAKMKLTQRQKDVAELFLAGHTQQNIGNIIGIHQTSVHKCLFGNLLYSEQYVGKRYGGLLQKIKKHSSKSIRAKRLWEKLNKLASIDD